MGHRQHHGLPRKSSKSFRRKEGSAQGSVPPKGWVAIKVGQEGEEEPQRFVVPVVYLNHPLFAQLLKEAEEEYGFEQKGAITIPCHVEHFWQVQGMIESDNKSGHPHHRQRGHQTPQVSCFGGLKA